MIRLFGRLSSSEKTPEAAPPEPVAQPQPQPQPQPTFQQSPEDQEQAAPAKPVEIQLREPTDEELRASFMSRQDFIDLERIMPAAAPQIVPARPIAPPPPAPSPAPVAAPAAPPPPPAAAAAPIPHPAAEATPAADARNLVGYWDGLTIGGIVAGWAGDPENPARRTTRITAIVDGKPVMAVMADIERGDTPHAGFRMPFTDKEIARYLIEERIELIATSEGCAPTRILPLPVVLSIARDARARELEREGTGLGPLAPTPKAADELSLFRLPVGLQSPDGAAIVGREGFLFAHHGDHDVHAQYQGRGTEPVRADANKWLALFDIRASGLARRGTAYLQAILPEKATVLPALAPANPTPMTARLELIEGRLSEMRTADAAAAPYYRGLAAALRACHGAGIAPYLRMSDDFRTIGAQLCFYQLVQQLGALFPDKADAFAKIAGYCSSVPPTSTESAPFTGDLARRFTFPLYETELVPGLDAIAPMIPPPPAVGDLGRGIGYRTWTNPAAPCELRVLLFGFPATATATAICPGGSRRCSATSRCASSRPCSSTWSTDGARTRWSA